MFVVPKLIKKLREIECKLKVYENAVKYRAIGLVEEEKKKVEVELSSKLEIELEKQNVPEEAEMDKSMIEDLDSLPEADKLKMAAIIDQLQIRDSLRMYNSLVERCFTDCVDNFRRKTLDKQEETCIRRCAEKFLKHSMRVGMRFAELNQAAPTAY